MINNNNYYNIQKIPDKGLKKVNYVKIGLVTPNYVNPNVKNLMISPPKKPINLPQIKQNVSNKIITTDPRMKIYFTGVKNPVNQINPINKNSNYSNCYTNNNNSYNQNKNININNFPSKDVYGYITKSLANEIDTKFIQQYTGNNIKGKGYK